MTQFQIYITREPNKLGSSITPHFKGKRVYFLIKKNHDVIISQYLLMSA